MLILVQRKITNMCSVHGPLSDQKKKHNYTQNSRKNITQNNGFNDNLKPGQVTEKSKGRQ